MNNNEKPDYDKMGWLYSALYGDMSTEELREFEYAKNHMELLQSYSNKNISILDSACGNGIQATAFALNGYNVTATDISCEMITLTKELASKHNVSINTMVKSWSDLPSVYNEQFDIDDTVLLPNVKWTTGAMDADRICEVTVLTRVNP